MEFFLFFALVFLGILACLFSRRLRVIEERLNNVEFITGILRAAYNADKAEKTVETPVEDV